MQKNLNHKGKTMNDLRLKKPSRKPFRRLKIAAVVLLATAVSIPSVFASAETDALRAQLRAAQQAIAAMEARLQQLEAKPVANVTQINEEAVMVNNVTYQKKTKADPNRSFEVYGFAQLDAIQDFDRVNPDWEDTLRASKIPTADGDFGSDGQSMMSVKQSRLGVNTVLPVGGKPLKTKFEFDMYGTGSDAGQTTMRLRHAYGEWDQILAGQTNSVFMDGNIFPNTIDYWGPAGMVFLRNPQIRWTPISGENTFAVALEDPSNDVDFDERYADNDPTGVVGSIQSDEKLPDLTAHYRTAGDWGHVQMAAIARRLGYECVNDDNQICPDNEPNGHEAGYGVNLTSSLVVTDKDKLHLSAVSGKGIANYLNDGGNDLSFGGTLGDVTAEPIELWGLMAYYDHYWSDRWSSSIGWGTTRVSNEEFQAADAFNRGDYASLNLLHTPAKNLMFGTELLHGKRQDNDGATGYDTRVQFTAKYIFSSNDFQ
jgi:hypothetical protein